MKVTEKQLWDALRANGGLFARTARELSAKIGQPITRQAVRDRALKKPELLEDIKGESLDVAEEVLTSIIRGKDKRLALDATKFYLKTQGKSRGYVERIETEIQEQGSIDIERWISDNGNG